MSEFVLRHSKALVTQLRETDPEFLSSWPFLANKLDDVLRLMVFREATVSRQAVLTRSRFIRESLRTALLQDLQAHFFPEEQDNNTEGDEEDTSICGRIKLTLLAIAGTIYNICNGFDSSVSILTLVTGIPIWIVFVAGLLLSFVFVILFYGIDFVSISENLHIRSPQSKQLLDFFHFQAFLTQSLLQKTKQRLQAENNRWLERLLESPDATCDSTEVSRWLILLEGLTIHQEELNRIRHWYKIELNQYYVRLLKGCMIALAGLLYFNSGFFAGQVFAVVVLSAFISAPISLLSWPVMLISCCVGLAGLLSVFWFSDRLDVESLVIRWIGLDIDKIRQLPDDKVIEMNRTYLDGEKQHLALKMRVHQRFLLMKPVECSLMTPQAKTLDFTSQSNVVAI